MEYFDNRLRELREKKGLKLDFMAKKMQMSRPYLSQLELNTRRISMKDYCQALDILGYELCIRKKGEEDSLMNERIIDRVLIEDEQYEKVDRNLSFEALANRIDCYNNLIEKFYMVSDPDLLEFTDYDEDDAEDLVFENRLVYDHFNVTNDEDTDTCIVVALNEDDWDVDLNKDIIKIYKDDKNNSYIVEQISSFGRVNYLNAYHSENDVITACVNLKKAYHKNINSLEKIDLLDKSEFKFDLATIDTQVSYEDDIKESKHINTTILDSVMYLQRLMERFNTVYSLYVDAERCRELLDIEKENIIKLEYTINCNSKRGDIDVLLEEEDETLLNIICSKDMNNNVIYDLNYIELSKEYTSLGRLYKAEDVLKFILTCKLDNKDIKSIDLEDIIKQPKYFYCDPNYEKFVVELIDETKKYHTEDGRKQSAFFLNKGYIQELKYVIDDFNRYSDGKLTFLDIEYKEGLYISRGYNITANNEDNDTYKFTLNSDLDIYTSFIDSRGYEHPLGKQKSVQEALNKAI